MDLPSLAAKAQDNRFYRWLLTYQLNHKVPFNRPHRLRVEEISAQSLTLKLPLRKRNQNHLGGLHACAMATLAEACSGFLLISNLDPRRYRLILKELQMTYHYQGKTAATATFELPQETLERSILQPLQESDRVLIPCQTEIYDQNKEHLATGTAYWQIKDWNKVQSK